MKIDLTKQKRIEGTSSLQKLVINNNDAKLEEKVEELRATLFDSVMEDRQSIQTVQTALENYMHQS